MLSDYHIKITAFGSLQGTPVSERAVPVAIFETDAGKFSRSK